MSSYAKSLNSAYDYVNMAMNKLGIDERNELQLLMNPDDMFGGHALLNQTLVRYLYQISDALRPELQRLRGVKVTDSGGYRLN